MVLFWCPHSHSFLTWSQCFCSICKDGEYSRFQPVQSTCRPFHYSTCLIVVIVLVQWLVSPRELIAIFIAHYPPIRYSQAGHGGLRDVKVLQVWEEEDTTISSFFLLPHSRMFKQYTRSPFVWPPSTWPGINKHPWGGRKGLNKTEHRMSLHGWLSYK